MSTALPRHINDSDFDPTTTHGDLDREGLTDTTFALFTYHAQRIGRLLNFAGHDRKVDRVPSTTSSSTPHSRQCDPNWPQQQVRCFEQEALRLLHFCDPGASAYAWFTWHGTQSLIATARLAALRPLQRSGQSPPPRQEGNPKLLHLCLPVLEKAYIMNTDVRAEGFRWYVTIPWHALAIAMAECYVSSDTALVQSAWPLVEMSYLQYKATLGQSPGFPLERLMRRTKEKLAVTAPLPLGSLTSPSWSPTTPPVFTARDPSQGSDSRIDSNRPWPLTAPTTLADLGSSSILPLLNGESLSPALENTSSFAPTAPAAVDGLDPGTEMTWEELFSGVPFNEIAGADVFFFETPWP
ncbi:hypothetical protein PITC_029370 [Penicillium italicum]|uniref:Transcription factor, fungi n=1 Tax=Penicillium italicum TaxID=40296 RepID=A0A0A2KLQ5_PENIT|nr:hypothetical protein PITC_029370 [Penicillium italicum]